MEGILVRAATILSTVSIGVTFAARRHELFTVVFLAMGLLPLVWIEIALMWARSSWMPDETLVSHHLLRSIAYFAVARLFDAYNVRPRWLALGTAVFLFATTPGLITLAVVFALAEKRLIKLQ